MRMAPFSTIPQWPWLMYSQRQTSVITTRSSPRRALMALAASWVIPSSAYAWDAISSLFFGMPKRMTAGTPRDATSSASSTTFCRGNWYCPGIVPMGSLLEMDSFTNKGYMRSSGARMVAFTMDRILEVLRNLRILTLGNVISLSLLSTRWTLQQTLKTLLKPLRLFL